ncbi:hypothetical protein PFLmoz3_03752 [Pseudomonas fluorescens]|uniref:Uncharacterized protein n=1 Tax=Pseudomonas fluorescens TaxID=294 RepID=A0A120G743_PSEFL|nr:hypothetical protein PFLmoz3_03752 [Pseudomonas fluorescens]
MPVHACLACAFFVFRQDMRGERHHWRAHALVADFPCPQLLCGGEAIENRHFAVHQYQVIALGFHRLQRFFAVAGGVRVEIELAEHAANHFGGNAVVFGYQDAEIAGHGHGCRCAGGRACHGCAFAALGQFISQGGLEGIASHRFGEDALDPAVARNDLARCVTDSGEHDQQDVVVQARVFLDFRRQLHAGHAGHVLVQQYHVEIITQVRLGAQQRQGLLARRHGADVQAPGRALLHQDFAAGVVVVHHQHAGVLERAVEVAGRVFQAFRVQRQGQPQGTALVAPTLDAELAVHQQDQLACDDQAQVAAQARRRKEVLAVQFAVQQGVAFGSFHGHAAVLHGNAQAWLGAALIQGDNDQHFAFIGFVQGVFQKAQ